MATAGAYLDHAATTPLSEAALEAMLPFLASGHANPSSTHRAGRLARRTVDDARGRLAELLGCSEGEVVFTSGGTEADNLAIGGAHAARPGEIVVSAVEHPAVLEPARALGGRLVGVDRLGRVDLGQLGELCSPATTLCSVMAANNETGIVQPLDAVADVVAARAPEALLHSDAVQAFPWLDPALATARFDLVSYSAHKFGGPMGVGALVVRGRARRRLAPLLRGGPQEFELRAGSENVAGIVGMAAAASDWATHRKERAARVGGLAQRLLAALVSAGGAATVPATERVAGICHCAFPGIEAEELLLLLDRESIAASAGSACASGAIEPSHVLIAMGFEPGLARCALRFSLGATTTEAEVDLAAVVIAAAVAQLRDGGS